MCIRDRGVTGSLWDLFAGMVIFGMEISTMTPFTILAIFPIQPRGFEREYRCMEFTWKRRKREATSGEIYLEGPKDAVNLTGECNFEDGSKFSIKSMLYEVKNPMYSAKEAGLRARSLIGQSIQKFKASEVISYAGIDVVYLGPVMDCWTSLADIKDASGPAPGVTILGKDGKHCAIIDHEGTKFIHSNPVRGVVTEDSMALLNRYFPNGYVYKNYTESPSVFKIMDVARRLLGETLTREFINKGYCILLDSSLTICPVSYTHLTLPTSDLV
eukprot:TRINITY_DN2891_c0_g1_i23.p1 TRINITY_DN2891_c0_g1~~TRINITY_DN2891_c0_g1_i23.p1  ORF type:complete len:272 (-),score=16.15 TRINITY_DN2891_c0_g1_i23:47-862(-)